MRQCMSSGSLAHNVAVKAFCPNGLNMGAPGYNIQLVSWGQPGANPVQLVALHQGNPVASVFG